MLWKIWKEILTKYRKDFVKLRMEKPWKENLCLLCWGLAAAVFVGVMIKILLS